MSVEYEYTNRELTETYPDLTNIHAATDLDEQIAGHCGITKTFYLNFEETYDESGNPDGKGTVTAIWSEALCNDCKTAFDTIVNDNAPEAT